MSQLAVNCALGAWAATVMGADLYARRVPNLLLLLLLLPAIVWLAWHGHGLLGATPLQTLAGALIASVPLLPGYGLGMMGAGDVKLCASLGLLLGTGGALELLLLGSVFLGVLSAAILLLRKLRMDERRARIPAAPAFVAAFALELCFGRVLT